MDIRPVYIHSHLVRFGRLPVPLGIHPTVDFVFKLIFGDPRNVDLLIHLLNSILELDSPIVHVVIQNPFNEKTFRDAKLSIVDIKARDENGIWFTIEMQTTLPTGFRNRLVYYASVLYHGQMREGDGYQVLDPVFSICFVTVPMFPNVQAGKLKFALHDAQHGVSFGDQMQLYIIQLPYFHRNEDQLDDASPLEIWAFFLNNAHRFNADKLRKLLPETVYQTATKVLEMVAHNSALRLIYDDHARAEWDRLALEKDAQIQKQALDDTKEALHDAKEALGAALVEGERGVLMGRIHAFQLSLALPELDAAAAATMDNESLSRLANQLRQQVQNRNAS